MTLTIHKEEDEQRQLKLKVEVDEARVEKAMRDKARDLSRQVRIPGFRQGKVPYRVLLRRLGEETIRAEAVEDMIGNVFEEAIGDIEAEPYGQPTLEDMQLEPLVLEFTVPLEPVVELGDYRAMRKEIEPVEVTDEAVEEALERVQARHQELEPVERPVEPGDQVTISGRGEFVGEAESAGPGEGAEDEEASDNLIFEDDHLELVMDKKRLFPGTPFVDHIVGLSAGEKQSFTFTFPEDYEQEELAGREAAFEVEVLDVKNRRLPPLDDELAKQEGDFETIDELRENIRRDLERHAEEQAKEELIDSTVEAMLEDAEIAYPPAAVEMEIDEMISTFKNQISRSGWQMEDYLKIQGSSEEMLREDFRESAEDRLERRLVLRQFILDERLRVREEDVDEIVEERISRFENEELRDSMRNFYRSGQGFDSISSEVLSNKVFERMQAVLRGEAPDLEALAAEEEAEAELEEE